MGDKNGSPLRHNSSIGDPVAGDEPDGDWTAAQVREMDLQFRERVERAFRHGLESPAAAAGIPLATMR
jgi:hypothetical protein